MKSLEKIKALYECGIYFYYLLLSAIYLKKIIMLSQPIPKTKIIILKIFGCHRVSEKPSHLWRRPKKTPPPVKPNYFWLHLVTFLPVLHAVTIASGQESQSRSLRAT